VSGTLLRTNIAFIMIQIDIDSNKFSILDLFLFIQIVWSNNLVLFNVYGDHNEHTTWTVTHG